MTPPKPSLHVGRTSPITLANSFPTKPQTRATSSSPRLGTRRPPIRHPTEMARDAVIVSVARTPIGRAYRGAFNATPAPTLAAYAIRAAVERAGVDPDEIEDCVIGAAM